MHTCIHSFHEKRICQDWACWKRTGKIQQKEQCTIQIVYNCTIVHTGYIKGFIKVQSMDYILSLEPAVSPPALEIYCMGDWL